MPTSIGIMNKTRMRIPRLPILSLRNDILGKDYDLSVVYLTPALSQKLNYTHRGKNKPTNVLSFSLDKNSGELVFCPSLIRKEAPVFEKKFEDFFGFLVIHGMLHLKGMGHGSIMEKEERKYVAKYFSGDRHRNHRSESRGGRIRKGRKSS